MRLSTTAWFAAGCGLALAVLTVGSAGGRMVLDTVRAKVSSANAESVALQSMTPAADPASEHTVMPPTEGLWSDVPVQRPRDLRESPSVAPPPPLPFHTGNVDDGVEWEPGEARLPPLEATEHWNPDDARIPDGAAIVAMRAFWNPNSAVLPHPIRFTPVTWNPDDARLPSS